MILFLHNTDFYYYYCDRCCYYYITIKYEISFFDRHNEDGSYSYGFEAADGSYKIESKYPTGEVYGKYGFVDDTGNVREIEYGASRRGFEPVGPGINVPPPTLTGNSIAGANEPNDDGQYREDPSIYHTDPRFTNGERYDPMPKYRQPIAYHQPQQFPSASPAYSQPTRCNVAMNFDARSARPLLQRASLRPIRSDWSFRFRDRYLTISSADQVKRKELIVHGNGNSVSAVEFSVTWGANSATERFLQKVST